MDRLPDVGAAIDIGSNSVHLLVAEVAAGPLTPRVDASQILGLGAHVDLEGHIGTQHGAEAIRLIAGYVALARESSAGWIVLVGTEPLRRAADRSAFCREVEATVGLPLVVLSHDEEALLTVLGVLGGQPAPEPTLIIDIGGGSSELVLLEPGSDPVVGVMPVGSARLTAAFVEDDPPTLQEVEALRSEARRLMTGMPAGRPTRGIVVGGSGMNLLHLLSSIDGDEAPGASPDPRAAGDGHIDRDRTQRAIEITMSRPSRELAEAVGLRERRILQMAAGASIIEAVLDSYGLDQLEASDASLREGAIRARMMADERWLEQVGRLVTGG